MAEQSIVRDAIARALTFINDYCRCAPSAVKARAIADQQENEA